MATAFKNSTSATVPNFYRISASGKDDNCEVFVHFKLSLAFIAQTAIWTARLRWLQVEIVY